MLRSSLIRGPLAAVACILQLLVGGGSGLADAWLESASTGPATAHVEEPGSQTCPPVHAEDCVVCRQLTALYSPEDPGTPEGVAAGRSTKPGAPTERLASARLADTRLPRGPPLS